MILQRKAGESIMIGDDIEIKVLGYNATTGVRIGIEAPREITILRTEVRDRDQQQEAMAHTPKLGLKQAD